MIILPACSAAVSTRAFPACLRPTCHQHKEHAVGMPAPCSQSGQQTHTDWLLNERQIARAHTLYIGPTHTHTHIRDARVALGCKLADSVWVCGSRTSFEFGFECFDAPTAAVSGHMTSVAVSVSAFHVCDAVCDVTYMWRATHITDQSALAIIFICFPFWRGVYRLRHVPHTHTHTHTPILCTAQHKRRMCFMPQPSLLCVLHTHMPLLSGLFCHACCVCSF